MLSIVISKYKIHNDICNAIFFLQYTLASKVLIQFSLLISGDDIKTLSCRCHTIMLKTLGKARGQVPEGEGGWGLRFPCSSPLSPIDCFRNTLFSDLWVCHYKNEIVGEFGKTRKLQTPEKQTSMLLLVHFEDDAKERHQTNQNSGKNTQDQNLMCF